MARSKYVNKLLGAPLLCFAAAFILAGCVGNKDDDSDKKIIFQVSPTSLPQMGWEGGEVTIEITANSKWQFIQYPAWGVPDNTDGKTNKTVKAVIESNTDTDWRDGRFIITNGTDEKSLYIKQDGKTEPDNIFNEIADPLFLSFLKSMSPAIDSNGDGILSPSEAAAVKSLSVTGEIVSLEGITHFTQLETLECRNNHISDLDLTGLLRLKRLDCSDNQSLVSLKLTGCISLETLVCSSTSLESVDLSNLTRLSSMHASHNPQMKTITLRGNTTLNMIEADNSGLINFDGANCPNLKDLFLNDSAALEEIILIGCPQLSNLNCANTAITELNISFNRELVWANCAPCPALRRIYVWWDPLSSPAPMSLSYDPEQVELALR